MQPDTIAQFSILRIRSQRTDNPHRQRIRVTNLRRFIPMGKWLFVALVASSFAGCASFTNPGEIDPVFVDGNQQVHRISWDATRRGTYVIRNDEETLRLVSEPPPDVALQTLVKLAANYDAKTQAATGSFELNQTIQAISRAIVISFLRESLYRASEAYVNGGLSPQGYTNQFSSIIDASTALAALGTDADKELVGDVLAQLLGAKQRLESLLAQAGPQETINTEVLNDAVQDLRSSVNTVIAKTVDRYAGTPHFDRLRALADKPWKDLSSSEINELKTITGFGSHYNKEIHQAIQAELSRR